MGRGVAIFIMASGALLVLPCLASGQVTGGPPPPFPSYMLAPPVATHVDPITAPDVSLSTAPIGPSNPNPAAFEATTSAYGLQEFSAAAQQQSDMLMAEAYRQALLESVEARAMAKKRADADAANWAAQEFLAAQNNAMKAK